MRIFALDCHIGIRDIQVQFKKLGHILDVHSLSDHAHLMGWKKEMGLSVSAENWRGISQQNYLNFYQTHKAQLSRYDGFVCFYPPMFSLLYEPFNKPILTQVPIRQEVPFENKKPELDFFLSHLQKTIDSGQLKPLANNRLDQELCSQMVGRPYQLIPSLCDYLGQKYNPTKNTAVIHGDLHQTIPLVTGTSRLASGYSWKELYEHKAIVHFPYNNSIMSLFEHYSGNIPLLFPSDTFLIEQWRSNPAKVLAQVSWLKVQNLPPHSLYPIDASRDVNLYDQESVIKYVISKSDWNDATWMPHILKYDNWEHLKDLIHTTDFEEISAKMVISNQIREEKILKAWDTVLHNL